MDRSIFDLSLLFGHRKPELQFEFFKKGRIEVNGKWKIRDRSKVVTFKDGYDLKSKHNLIPSPAVDIGIYIPKRKDFTYDKNSLIYLAGLIHSVSVELYIQGKITHLVKWGGNWDNDNIILKDQIFMDLCHFELYKPKGE